MVEYFDFVVIGGGIGGLTTATSIANSKVGSVVLLEKEPNLGMHASTRNSGVLHSGINQEPGTQKAIFCLKGSSLLERFCQDQNVPIDICGTWVVSRTDDENKALQRIYDWGTKIGVPRLQIDIPFKYFEEREPNAWRGDIKRILYSPTGAVLDSRSLINALAIQAYESGVQVRLNEKVININKTIIITQNGEFQTKHIINNAGIYADKIAHLLGVGLEYINISIRGEYKELIGVPINAMVYHPSTNPKFPFLGVHVTKKIDVNGDRVIVGPNAMPSLGRESYSYGSINLRETWEMLKSPQFRTLLRDREFRNLAVTNTRISLSNRIFLKEVKNLVREELSVQLTLDSILSYDAGNRAQLVSQKDGMVNDFKILHGEKSTHVLCMVSPGMTSALAFGPYVANCAIEHYMKMN